MNRLFLIMMLLMLSACAKPDFFKQCAAAGYEPGTAGNLNCVSILSNNHLREKERISRALDNYVGSNPTVRTIIEEK